MLLKRVKTIDETIRHSLKEYKDTIFKDLKFILRIVDGEDRNYNTHVLKWNEDELIFEAPLYKRDWVIFPLPHRIQCIFLTSKAIYQAEIEIFDKKRRQDKLLYKGRLISPLTKKQQRAHFRLSILKPFSFSIIPQSIENLDYASENELYPATTINISCGGLCMTSKLQLEAQTLISIYLPLLDERFELVGRTLAKGELTPAGLYAHRIRFQDLTPQLEDQLRKCIFEKQRQMLARPKRPLHS